MLKMDIFSTYYPSIYLYLTNKVIIDSGIPGFCNAEIGKRSGSSKRWETETRWVKMGVEADGKRGGANWRRQTGREEEVMITGDRDRVRELWEGLSQFKWTDTGADTGVRITENRNWIGE